jgi:stage II sporulation protein D
MRRFLTLTALTLALALPGAAASQVSFSFTGFGWGHAVGMAQYGSYGFAQNGWAYDRILAHYYRGTTLGPAPAKKIRVLLARGGKAVEISSEAPFRVRDGGGVHKLPAGAHRLGADLVLTGGGEPRTLVSPVRFMPAGSPLRVGGKAYRGSIVVTLVDGKLTVVNHVGLEPYVKGVVAGEMPAHWHPEALKVQAVAARSYALVSRETEGLFDVFSDTRSQVYGGIAAEETSTNAAVDATRLQVVLHEGKVAWTFFSSSSGGKTAGIQEVWPDSEPLPYLVSVDDPYDSISPYHTWGPVTFTAASLEAKLRGRLPAGLTELVVNRGPSGRAATVTAIGTGGTKEIPAWDLRMLLGLRSTWFSISSEDASTPAEGSAVTSSLAVSAKRIVYGDEVTLSGSAEGVRRVAIEQRAGGGEWSLLRRVTVRDGRFQHTVAPLQTTSYRVRQGGSGGRAVRVTVAARVTLANETGSSAVRGSMRPVLPGTNVTIERLAGGEWLAVATAQIDAEGSFAAIVPAVSGVYRARVPASPGLAAGSSAHLTIDAG